MEFNYTIERSKVFKHPRAIRCHNELGDEIGIQYVTVKEGIPFLNGIDVTEKYRNLGIAKQLRFILHDILKKDGFEEVIGYVNSENLAGINLLINTGYSQVISSKFGGNILEYRKKL